MHIIILYIRAKCEKFFTIFNLIVNLRHIFGCRTQCRRLDFTTYESYWPMNKSCKRRLDETMNVTQYKEIGNEREDEKKKKNLMPERQQQ